MSHITRDHKEKGNYRTHSNTHAYAGVAFVCVLEFCGRKCADVKELMGHLKEHLSVGLKVSCPFDQCDKAFDKKSSFTLHLSRCHKNYRDSVQDIASKYLVLPINASRTQGPVQIVMIVILMNPGVKTCQIQMKT